MSGKYMLVLGAVAVLIGSGVFAWKAFTPEAMMPHDDTMMQKDESAMMKKTDDAMMHDDKMMATSSDTMMHQ